MSEKPYNTRSGICPICGEEIVWEHPMTPGYGIHGKCKPEALRIILEHNTNKIINVEERESGRWYATADIEHTHYFCFANTKEDAVKGVEEQLK